MVDIVDAEVVDPLATNVGAADAILDYDDVAADEAVQVEPASEPVDANNPMAFLRSLEPATRKEHRRCPACGEQVHERAVQCRYCECELEPRTRDRDGDYRELPVADRQLLKRVQNEMKQLGGIAVLGFLGNALMALVFLSDLQVEPFALLYAGVYGVGSITWVCVARACYQHRILGAFLLAAIGGFDVIWFLVFLNIPCAIVGLLVLIIGIRLIRSIRHLSSRGVNSWHRL